MDHLKTQVLEARIGIQEGKVLGASLFYLLLVSLRAEDTIRLIADKVNLNYLQLRKLESVVEINLPGVLSRLLNVEFESTVAQAFGLFDGKLVHLAKELKASELLQDEGTLKPGVVAVLEDTVFDGQAHGTRRKSINLYNVGSGMVRELKGFKGQLLTPFGVDFGSFHLQSITEGALTHKFGVSLGALSDSHVGEIRGFNHIFIIIF